MAKLIVNPTSSSKREVPLPRSMLSIGRDPSNDLILPDAMVSRRHAVIEFRGAQYFLRDCNSSNGSLVNGDKVSERNLRDGDLVSIGTARLLFREEREVEGALAKVLQHPSAPRLQCPSCSADYRKGDQFCRQCGVVVQEPAPSKAVCVSCGSAVPLPANFCNACGRPLAEEHPDLTRPRPVSDDAHATMDGEAVSAAPLRSGGSSEAARAEAPLPAARPSAAPAPLRREARPSMVPRLPPRVSPGLEPADFATRLAAGLVDGAIVLAGQAVVASPVAYYWYSLSRASAAAPAGDVPFLPILVSVALVTLILLLGSVYYVHGWGIRGATPGKRWLGLAVEGADGSFPIGAGRAAFRLCGYALSVACLGIGFLMIAFGGDGLHDRIAGTRVVRRPL